MLWIFTTIAAAAAQTARNAMQSSLTSRLGPLGATQVRFVFGFPFALMFFTVAAISAGVDHPAINSAFLIAVAGGAIAQILGTLCLLLSIRDKGFAVATAFTKTEAVQVAVFGLVLLGEALTVVKALAILIATAGVALIAIKPGELWKPGTLVPALYGIASGGLYALAALGFRSAILSLDPSVPFFVQASTALAWSLGAQALLLGVSMLAFDRPSLIRSFQLWRESLFAGFMGALASQFWFLGFSLTTAANVRTLGLVEVLFAQAVSRRVFLEATSVRELAGMALVVLGVGMLIAFAV